MKRFLIVILFSMAGGTAAENTENLWEYQEVTPGKTSCLVSYQKRDLNGQSLVEIRRESEVQRIPLMVRSGLPWIPTPLQLRDFIMSSQSEMHFSAPMGHLDQRLQAQDTTEMVASKKEFRDGVWKVRVSFADLRSLIWGADYWYRAKDGVLCRYEEVRGGPGTPVTVGTLVKEGSW